MSTQRCCSAWKLPMGLPNCERVRRYASVCVSMACPTPSSSAACRIWPAASAWRSASCAAGPSASTASGGSSTCSKRRLAAWLPSTSGIRVSLTPAVPRGTHSSTASSLPRADTSQPLAAAPGSTMSFLALQQHAARMARARLAAAGERHGAQVARALLPSQCGQGAAGHQLGKQRLRVLRFEPRQQQRAETRHRQQRFGRDVLAGRPQYLRGTGEAQGQAAGRFRREHAGPTQLGERAPALRLVGIGVLHALAPALDGTAANEVVERGFAYCGE